MPSAVAKEAIVAQSVLMTIGAGYDARSPMSVLRETETRLHTRYLPSQSRLDCQLP